MPSHDDTRSDDDRNDSTIDSLPGETDRTVEPTCPDCASDLDLKDVHLGNEGDAYAWARCASSVCDWNGDAVFAFVAFDRD